jgi:hypothetical protein
VLVVGGRLVTVTPVAPPTTFGALISKVAGRYLLDPRGDLEAAGLQGARGPLRPSGLPVPVRAVRAERRYRFRSGRRGSSRRARGA